MQFHWSLYIRDIEEIDSGVFDPVNNFEDMLQTGGTFRLDTRLRYKTCHAANDVVIGEIVCCYDANNFKK